MILNLIDNRYKTRDFTKSAELIIQDPSLLPELIEVATSDLKHPYPEYASWLLIHVVKKVPEIVEPFQHCLIDTILSSKNQSVLRNLTNVCVELPLIEYRESEFLDRLIEFLKDDSNKVALFVYAIYKLIQFTIKYPEIKHEILGIIDLKQSRDLPPSIKIGIRNYLKATKNIH